MAKWEADNLIDAAEAIAENARLLAYNNRTSKLTEEKVAQIKVELRHDIEDALKSLTRIENGER
mgnify:CR=1 FL=1